jgi:hypothetical protein
VNARVVLLRLMPFLPPGPSRRDAVDGRNQQQRVGRPGCSRISAWFRAEWHGSSRATLRVPFVCWRETGQYRRLPASPLPVPAPHSSSHRAPSRAARRPRDAAARRLPLPPGVRVTLPSFFDRLHAADLRSTFLGVMRGKATQNPA